MVDEHPALAGAVTERHAGGYLRYATFLATLLGPRLRLGPLTTLGAAMTATAHIGGHVRYRTMAETVLDDDLELEDALTLGATTIIPGQVEGLVQEPSYGGRFP